MLVKIAFVIVFFIEMLIATIFFNSISEKKKSLPFIVIAGTLIFETGSLINIFGLSTSWLNVTFSIAVTILHSVLFFKIKPKKAVFYSVLLVAISTFLEHIVIFIISSLKSLYLTNYQSETPLLVIEVILSKIIYFLFTMLLLKFTQKDKKDIKIPSAFYIFPIITLISVICFWYISINQHLEIRNQIILGFVSTILLFATLFVFFLVQANTQRENKLLLLQQEQDKIKTDIIYYDILEKQNNNLREYAHDAHKHISAIKDLNADPEIDSYVSQMLESLEKHISVSHSGNRILDVIINKYVTECNIHNIKFTFDVKNNNLTGLEYHDTVTILGNLLDNAIEASLNSKEKSIVLETDFRNNYSIIIISNSCDIQPKFDSTRTPITTKQNKVLHGFGLRSVKKTIQKYDGDFSLEYDKHKKTFIITTMLNLNKKDNY